MFKLTASEVTELGLYMEHLAAAQEQHLVLIQKITHNNITMKDYGDENSRAYKINYLSSYTYAFIGPLESFDSLPSTYPEYLL